jgi:hypothetical protein
MQLDPRKLERHARTFTRGYPNSETAKATWMSRKKKAIIYMENQEGIRKNGRTYDSVLIIALAAILVLLSWRCWCLAIIFTISERSD